MKQNNTLWRYVSNALDDQRQARRPNNIWYNNQLSSRELLDFDSASQDAITVSAYSGLSLKIGSLNLALRLVNHLVKQIKM
jgi:hypothetical protein